ncbi:MAG: hypothetical protein LBN02_05220 [Oscillospiraceae bacterium]|jgi:hypothetical protein|nr:hypothetical protein [Oscillospiraceae bacterium]
MAADAIVNLDLLPRDGERALSALADGRMVVARSDNDFLYVIDFEREFHMFSHTIGAPGGGQRQFPKNEKYRATVKKVAELADAVYAVEYDHEMNIYGVMATAEDAILSMFPGGASNVATVEFAPWDRDKNAREAEEGYEGETETADPFGEFRPELED